MSHGRLSDDRIARAAAQGDPSAFEEIYARYQAPLYGYCLSILHDPEEARDALQNTMEKAIAAIATQRVTGGLRAWLFGIAHNEAISLTRLRTGAEPFADDVAVPAAVGDPADRERLSQLVQDLKTLPEQQRSALVLRELSGLGSEEIGSALGISPAAARQAVYEARASLLAQTGGRDMDCRQVQGKLSEADGRRLRGRRLRAHVADCALCSAFGAAIPGRRADMQLLFPPLGAALVAQTLAAATGTGAAGHTAAAAATGGRRSQVATAGTAATVIAAVVVGALALSSPEGTPATSTPPAEAADTPASPAKAAPGTPDPAATASAAQRPPAAVAGYTDLGSGVLGTLESSGSAGAAGAAGGTAGSAEAVDAGDALPFTGLDVAALLLAGAALVGLGAGLHRVARAPRL